MENNLNNKKKLYKSESNNNFVRYFDDQITISIVKRSIRTINYFCVFLLNEVRFDISL